MIDHIKGSIKVIGYDGTAVIVIATTRHSGNESIDKTQNGGLRRIASKIIQLSAQEQDNVVIVQTNSHKNTIDLDIRVPINSTLKLKTYHNGKIHVQDVTIPFKHH